MVGAERHTGALTDALLGQQGLEAGRGGQLVSVLEPRGLGLREASHVTGQHQIVVFRDVAL